MSRTKYFTHVFPHWPRLARLLIMISIFLFSFGIVIHLVEPETFQSIFDGIWWAIVTISTVGYGDIAPESTAGRIIGILLILSGAGLVTRYFATISAIAVSSEKSYMAGKKEFTREQHIIIVGWNERSRGIIEQLQKIRPKTPIVLIDDTLQEHPVPTSNIHFIQGKANMDDTLLKANVKSAQKVLITADMRQDENQTDMFSIITLLAVKGLNHNIYCLVEILTKNQIFNALRAGADGIIETNKFASELMIESLTEKQVPNVYGFVSDSLYGSLSTSTISIENNWKNFTFRDLCRIFIDKQLIIIGLNRGGNVIINPPMDFQITENDKLVVMKDAQ
jgi:voltage-gated potassium channel